MDEVKRGRGRPKSPDTDPSTGRRGRVLGIQVDDAILELIDMEVDLMKAQCLKEKVYPPDIARMVLWLAADDSRLVTAQNFVVDGGRM